MKKYLYLFLLLLQSMASYAHVGSAGVQMQAQAGAYKVLVNVTPPANTWFTQILCSTLALPKRSSTR